MAPKRSSTAGAGRPSKMAKKDTDMSKCAAIAAALELAQQKDVPPEVTLLLGNALKHSLPTFKEERHGFQAEIVDMVGKTLESSEAVLVAGVQFAEATLNGGDEERVKREAAVKETEAAFTAAQEEHKAKQAAKVDKAEAFKAALDVLKTAQAEQKTGDHDADAVAKSKEALEMALSACLAPLKETGGSKKLLSALYKQLAAIEIENSLLQAMELPLLQNPEKRGSFDTVIVENLEAQIGAKKAAMEATLQQAAPAKESRAAAVKAAQDANDVAKAASETANAELKAAKDAEAAAKAAAAAAKESVKALDGEIEAATSALDSARQSLEDFRSSPKAFFLELLERKAPSEEPSAPPSEEPAEAPVASA